MARFCFVSYAQPAHCDLGGMGYVRTARALGERGHDVGWVFSPFREARDLQDRAAAIVTRHGIAVDGSLALAAHDPEARPGNVAILAEHLRARRYDCVVVDPICLLAAFAAHRARIPWATVGTDGRDWQVRTLDEIHQMLIPGPAASAAAQRLASFVDDGFPQPSTRSWVPTSPFLAILFLPRECQPAAGGPEHPQHAHFLGCGPAAAEENAHSRLLITAGTSFDRPLLQQVAAAHRRAIAQRVPETLVLAGNRHVAQFLAAFYADVGNVRVEEWVPYEVAYRDAAASIGHGGLGHVWYALRGGVPTVSVPGHSGQFYRALVTRELGAGAAVFPRYDRSKGPFADAQDLNGLRIDEEGFADTVLALLADERSRARARALGEVMRAGGGVAAAASLLEALADHRQPVTRCAEPTCCC